MKKLNMRGFSHHLILPIVAIFAIGGIGAYVISRSSASTSYAIVSNWGDGAQPDVKVYKGTTKSTGKDVNQVRVPQFPTAPTVYFCGNPNSTYQGQNIYTQSGGQYFPKTNTSIAGHTTYGKTYHVKSTSSRPCTNFSGSSITVDLCTKYVPVTFSDTPSSGFSNYVKVCTLNNTTTQVK